MARGEFYSLNITQGERFYLRVVETQPTGEAIDLTGQTAKLRIGSAWNGTLVREVTGTCSAEGADFAISESNTLTIPAGQYVFDIFLTDSDGPRPVLRGPCIVDPAAVGGST